MSQTTFNFTGAFPPALLTPDEIFASGENIIQFKEDKRVERKPSGVQPRLLGEYISMWANSGPSGGLIAVGIADDGTPSGCHKLSQSQINDIDTAGAIYCSDARVETKRIRILAADGEESFLIVLRVKYREDKVVFDSSQRAYTRIGDQKHTLTPEQVRELQIDKGQLDLEQESVPLVYPGDFDALLIRRFLDALKERRGITTEHRDVELLVHRRLGRMRDGVFVPNIACAVLFARDPRGLFPGCKVRFLRIDGEFELTGDQYNVVKDVSVEGPIPHLINRTAEILTSHLREFQRFGDTGQFSIVPEYPKSAWFEAIVNACVHRTYGLKNMNIFVKMFDDKLVIESPGGFPPFVTPENIYVSHHPRNPHLMDALFYLDIVKEHGEGTNRMRDTMAKLNLPSPEFREVMSGGGPAAVRVTLRNNKKQRTDWVDRDVAHILGETITKDLSQEEKRTLNYMAENGGINVSQCLRINPSLPKWHAAKRLLERLREKGIVDHQHSPTVKRDPNAKYVLAGKLPSAH